MATPRWRKGLVIGLLAGLLAGCASPVSDRSIITTAPNGAREEIPVTISKPEGPRPFPAVVIMHDCSGLGLRSSGAPGRWARELGARGYVTVIPDSFTTRGHPDGVCTDASPSRGEVAPSRRVRDAYAALAHARAREARGLRRGGGALSELRGHAGHLARRRRRHLPVGRAAADPDRGER